MTDVLILILRRKKLRESKRKHGEYLFVSVLILPLSACLSKVSATTASNEDPPGRHVRSVGGQVVVQPVDCVLSQWTAWSRCDICQKKRVSMKPDR